MSYLLLVFVTSFRTGGLPLKVHFCYILCRFTHTRSLALDFLYFITLLNGINRNHYTNI